MKHSYVGIPAFSQSGMPISEYAFLSERLAIVTKVDYRSLGKKTVKEKLGLATAKSSFKKLSKNPYFKEYRDDLIKQIINRPPNWGGFKLVIV